MEKISVCMATYNGGKFIHYQLESILKQIKNNDEVVIADDSSKDRTIEIIKKFNDNRIKLFENNKFYNPIYNFEYALKHASGNIIFLADQDDIWCENKVEIISNCLIDYDLVVSDCEIIDENDNIIHDSFFKLRKSGKGFLKNFYKNSYLGCCMAFNRKILNIALPFPKNIPMHDWWIGMVSELYGKVYFFDEKLVKYRRHKTNKSPTTGQSNYSIFKKASFRISIMANLLKILFKSF